jgi:hypothetical protein
MLPNHHIIERVVTRMEARGYLDITVTEVQAAVEGNAAVLRRFNTPEDAIERAREEVLECGFDCKPLS